MNEGEVNPEIRRQQIFQRVTTLLTEKGFCNYLKPGESIKGEMTLLEQWRLDTPSLNLDLMDFSAAVDAIDEEFGVNYNGDTDGETIDAIVDFLVAHATK